MEYRINIPRESVDLLGNYLALEAQDLLVEIDNRSGPLPKAYNRAGITGHTYAKWSTKRELIDAIARDEFQSQFVRLSKGIRTVRNGKRHRFRETLELSLGLNTEHKSFGLDSIAQRQDVSPRTSRVRATYADFELLEGLGILRKRDSVNVVRHSINSAKRRGHRRRKNMRTVEQEDVQLVGQHLRALKEHKELRTELETLERRWGLKNRKRMTVREIAERDDVTVHTVLWRELSGTFAVHQHLFLVNQSIPEAVRVWAGLVFHVLAMPSSESKRLLARSLDSKEPWKIPFAVQKLQSDQRAMLYSLIGMDDGKARTVESLVKRNGESGRELRTRHRECIEDIAGEMQINSFTIPWMNTLSESISGSCSSKAKDVLNDKELHALQTSLAELEEDGKNDRDVKALRLRTGLSDDEVHSLKDIQTQTGVRSTVFQNTMHSFLRIIEQHLGKRGKEIT